MEQVTDLATVCMPWRPQPDRVAAFERVHGFWEHHGFKVVTADSRRGEPFSICRARNGAVLKAETPVVIVADADTIPDIRAVHEAVNTVENGQVVWPFDTYRHISSRVDVSDLHHVRPDQQYVNSVGGLFVCRRETYWSLGGMDERFEPRWGAEDTAFKYVAGVLGEVKRLPGTVYSFNHSADRDLSPESNPNMRRLELYKFASRSPGLMRELIKR